MSANPSSTDQGVQRRLGALTATLLVVASMVGTGVFTTTGIVLSDVPSATAVLVAWLLGGLLALSGALSYAELGAALPRNGGEYQLLGRIYHPAVGFVAGWVSLVVGFSAPIAASALAFGSYLAAVVPDVPPVAAAVVLIAALAALHGFDVRLGSGVQNAFTIGKILLVVGFALVGGLVAAGFVGGPAPSPAVGPEATLPTALAAPSPVPLSDAILSPAFAVALILVSFAYCGWNGAVYIAGEVRRPGRTLPAALLVGTALVVVLYLALNLVFLAAAPLPALAGKVEVGHVAAERLFGSEAGSVLSSLIALALVSSVSAMLMAGPRVYEAMGADHPPLRVLARRTGRGGPAIAAGLQAVVAIVMVLTASFGTLLAYIGFTLSISGGLTVIGVFVLRRREPSLERPYRTWGYPVTPAAFVALSAWMIVHTLWERPEAALPGLGTLAAGVLLWFALGRAARPDSPRPAAPRPHEKN